MFGDWSWLPIVFRVGQAEVSVRWGAEEAQDSCSECLRDAPAFLELELNDMARRDALVFELKLGNTSTEKSNSGKRPLGRTSVCSPYAPPHTPPAPYPPCPPLASQMAAPGLLSWSPASQCLPRQHCPTLLPWQECDKVASW